jgi:toxin ParE1/3/4
VAKVEISAAARADLKNIYKYTFTVFGEAQADRYTRDLHSRFALLADFPGMGLHTRLGVIECLKFPSGSHVIYYRRAPTGIFIGRILHGAQDQSRQRFGE